ncbi:EAL domain-containing protein [Curvibacter sp. APW13]|uniref:EAL and HDOD domain-containing protein n=1 Tax=Curvibacter sp. APW13 TaxID=3077236 RepID=UPI0028DF0F51|nr:HDOD domain-containing protein [Curvibacter sp. APW13]MDT8991007.1 EAL domain-containing protein [Curvibacter sp. APW13]
MNPVSPTQAAAAATAGTMAIAHQAIVNAQRKVFGYELFDRSVAADAHTAHTDAQMLFNALSTASESTMGTRAVYFVNCTHDSLAGGHLDLVAPQKVVLEIPPLPISQVDQIPTRLPVLQQMHQRGFRLAMDYSVLTKAYEAWLPLASFIKFDLSILKREALASFIKLAQAKSQAMLVAEKVETAEQFDALQSLGVGLFQGYWFAKPMLLDGHTIRPGQAHILHLINLVRRQASTDEIEEVFKHDPTLSFNLLRFINSAGFGLRNEITSFRHAVMLLGLNRLFKWAALLLTTSAGGNTPAAVGSTAVLRGRLMELLAQQSLPAEESDNAFVVGVFSLLDTMLGVPMETALGTLNLPTSVTDALLHRRGVLADYLELTLACENNDDAAFARTSTALGLTGVQVNMAHLEALAWAESLAA